MVSRSIPRRAAETLTPAAVPVATSRSTSSRLLIELIGLAFSLLAVAVAEPWALPRSVAGPVYTTAFSIGLGLAIALLVS